MVKKNYLIVTLLFLVMGILFAGCSAGNSDKVTIDKNNVKVETDEAKVETTPSTATVQTTGNQNQTPVEASTNSEIISSDNVEIGELI